MSYYLYINFYIRLKLQYIIYIEKVQYNIDRCNGIEYTHEPVNYM